MNPETLQDFLHTHIPATALLGLSVLETTAEQTVLFAPHAPNRNHKNTAFGGSIALRSEERRVGKKSFGPGAALSSHYNR